MIVNDMNVICYLCLTDAYRDGRKKAKEGELTSDLQSEADMDKPRKRKRNVRLNPLGGRESSSEAEEDQLPSPPKIFHSLPPTSINPLSTPLSTLSASTFSSPLSSLSTLLYTTPLSTITSLPTHSVSTTLPSVSSTTIPTQTNFSTYPTTIPTHTNFSTPLSTYPTTIPTHTNFSTPLSTYSTNLPSVSPNAITTPTNVVPSSLSSSPSPSFISISDVTGVRRQNGHQPTVCSSCFPYMKEMVTKMEMVLQQISILQAQHAASAAPPPAAVEGLPLTSKDDLMLLEARLMDPQEEERVISYLGLVGGLTVKDCVWRILQRAMTNDLAQSLNWRGANGKLPLSKFRLRRVITSAVRKNPLTASATDKEIETVVKRWLQLASDREGGRRRRFERAERQ
ncbi:uncharacterized protein LOC134467655 [Engraulis encrasicolus]|uniref:uncharacterized protein LOC134467655 n=1 Tax=Engraulis encrasicolus TaxID=184585 RepID=UPI002FCF6F5B